jgi:undecaprenyl-diphosphatase
VPEHHPVEALQKQAASATVERAVAQQRGGVFLLASSIAFVTFLALLRLVRRNHRLETDVIATLRMQRVRHPLLMRLLHAVSWLGFRPQSLLLPGSAVGGLWVLGFRRDARYLGLAWVGSMLSFVTKRVVQRPRPSGEGITVVHAGLRDSSFPSGHVLHYVAVWGFWGYLCFTRLRGRWLRWLPVGGTGGLIGLVGPSRIFLGHHWLTDVLAGYSLGAGYLSALVGLHRRRVDDPVHEPRR